MRVARPQPRRRLATLLATPLLAALVAFGAVVPAPATGAATWSRNLWVSSAFLYQDPYYTACTAAAAMLMLNTIAYRDTGGSGFKWTPYRVKSNTANLADYRDMTSILSFSRRYDTLRSTSAGSDAHGWRNALNYYGWGRAAMTDPARRPYDDRSYSTFTGAVNAAVKAIARRGMPVGVLGWAGGHAQVIHGYVVTGEDPRISSNFTVRYIYLSDPLKKNGLVNHKVHVDSFRSGSLKYRFQRYRETDSPYDDPHSAGTIRSAVKPSTAPSEWYGRYVLVLPIRQGVPAPPPAPDPTPTPEPTPAPTPTAEPSSSVDAVQESGAGTAATSPTVEPAQEPAPAPAREPTPAPTPQPTPAPTQTPAPPPTQAPTEEPSPSAASAPATEESPPDG